MESMLLAYLPQDRRAALAHGVALPDQSEGAALFADICGFTPLTEALTRALGPHRGAEELPHHLNQVYDALIDQVDRYGGSVIGFAGDAITCWFDQDQGLRATACALAMQQAMRRFQVIPLPSGEELALTIKVAVASGPVRRFLVGDPAIQYLDVLAGRTLVRMATAEQQANRGEVVLDAHAAQRLADQLDLTSWRTVESTGEAVAVVQGLHHEVALTPWPTLEVSDALLRPWLLPTIYQRLQAGQGEFLTELRPAVALFVRFDGLDYDQDPLAGPKLDAFVRWVQQVLVYYEGTLLQLTVGEKGNYLYAAFGAPITHEDDARRALGAALALQTVPEELNFIHSLQIGLSRGTMRTGAYGSQRRRTYGSLGDEVNLAARLMLHARPGQIVISGRLAAEGGQDFVCHPLGTILVKGKQEGVPIFQLLASPSQDGLQVRPPLLGQSRQEPLVGRVAEKEQLLAHLEALGRGAAIEGCVSILVEGEPGIGKTRLMEELYQAATQRKIRVLVGQADAIEHLTPYFAWSSVVRQFLQWDSLAAEPETRREQVLAQLDPAHRKLAPLLNALLPLELPETPLTASLTGQARAERTWRFLVQLLQQGAIPTLVMVEDAHWLDSASWALTLAVHRACASQGSPLRLLLASRPLAEPLPSEARAFLQEAALQRMPLGPLAGAEVLALLRQQLGVTVVPATLSAFIQARAEGNPFFSEEIAYALRDAGILQLRGGEAAMNPEVQDLQALHFPDTIQGVILSRIDRLAPAEQLTLKVASVVGRVFAFRTLHDIYPVEQERAQLPGYLAELGMLGLTILEVPPPSLTYIFRHIITQEVTYGLLPYVQRQALHQAVAAWYERSYQADLSSHYPLLAHHCQQAALLGKAVHYYTLAGDAAFRLHANTEACTHYRQALTIKKQPGDEVSEGDLRHLYLQYGRTLELLGRYEEAQATYLEMAQFAQAREDPSLALAALVARANLHSIPGPGCDFKQAIVLATQALQVAEQLGEQESQARILWLLMRTYWYMGEGHQSLDYAEKSLAIARALGLREQMAWTLNDTFGAYMSLGRLEEGLARHTEARGLWQALHNLPMYTDNLSTSAIFHYVLGHYAEVIHLSEEARRISEEIDNMWGQAHSRVFIGYVYLEYGQVERAIREMEECIHLGGQINLIFPLVETRANLGCLLGQLGLVEEGLRLVQLACADAERFDFFRALALGNRARLEVLAGHLAAAAATLATLAQMPVILAFPFEVYLRAMAEGELAFARQDYAAVLRQMDTLLHLLHQSQARAYLPDALHLKGQALLAQGASRKACKSLLEAREVAEALGSRWRLWSILFTLSELELRRGHTHQAHRYRHQATEILESIVTAITEPALRAAFLNTPRVRDVLL